MKVDGPKSVGPGAPSQKKRRQADGGFADELAELGQADTPAKPAAVTAAPVVDALWALQAVDDPTTGRSKAVARGEDLLDGLDDLRHAIMLGQISPERLERIAAGVQSQRTAVDDPRLARILDEIDLRAQVELAKYRRRG